MSTMRSFGDDRKFINSCIKQERLAVFMDNLSSLRGRLEAICKDYVIQGHNNGTHWTVTDQARGVVVANLWPTTEKFRIRMDGDWLVKGIRTDFGGGEYFLAELQRHFANHRRRS